MSKLFESVVREVVDHLARGEYHEAVESCDASRLTAEEVKQVVLDYGRTLAAPPADAYKELDVVQIIDPSRQAWSVRVPLWTQEEGRSDLTLELTVVLSGDKPSIELDDLHVL